jgi:hypothetical protein
MHSRAIALSIVASLGLAALAASLPSHAQGALKPVDALIVNPTNRPVPVTVLSSPAQPGEGSREIYSLFVPTGLGCVAQAVPAGKRLVLQHLSGTATMVAPAALRYVALKTQPNAPFDVLVPAAPPLSVGNTNFSAAGQQVHAYVDGDFEVCAAASSSDPGAVPFVSLRGYLVNKP